MNKDIMNGKWTEIKGEIRKVWGDVSGDDLEKSKGNLESISGLIQQKYGHKKEEVSEKLNSIVSLFGKTADDIKHQIATKTDEIKTDLKKQ